ncbi:MAG TPA: DUF2782 domain-containing protein [Usitatibacter sp.]|nr:DUF2782 domain-containing protein [Usitatibacter sp.]
MRILFFTILSALVFAAAAQTGARPRPPGTTPLEEPPPPPAMVEPDPTLEPQVSIRTEGESQVQEYRVRGKLYMMRVTPTHGHPYILMDHKGDGTFTKQDNTLDSGVRVPQWVLLEF